MDDRRLSEAAICMRGVVNEEILRGALTLLVTFTAGTLLVFRPLWMIRGRHGWGWDLVLPDPHRSNWHTHGVCEQEYDRCACPHVALAVQQPKLLHGGMRSVLWDVEEVARQTHSDPRRSGRR